MSNLNSNNKYDNYLVDFSSIKKAVKRALKKAVKKLNNKSGYVLIFLVFFFFIVGSSLVAGPAMLTVRGIQYQLHNSQIESAEATILTTNSPIRNTLVSQVYSKVQAQLIQHLQQSLGSSQYVCQGQYVQPNSTDPVTGVTVGDLTYQYGLCSPETLLDGIAGDTNKTMDLLSGLYPNYKIPLSNPSDEHIRQALIKNNINEYNYTIRSTYVGETALSQGSSSSTGANRLEQYRYNVRADVELFTHTYTEARTGLVINYEVFITNGFYVGNFYGGGNNCSQTTSYTNTCGTDPATGEAVNCAPVMVQNPDGSWGFAVQYGLDDPNYQPYPPGTPCPTVNVGGVAATECPLSGGRVSIAFKPRNTRIQTGCASASSGVQGVSGPDKNGYGFGITVRTVSVEHTYY